jgi:membrane protein YdbS with pleckstrin-like domain
VVVLKWSSSALIISLFCFVISIYLALPTFRNFDWLFGNLDDEVRLQLLVLATAFFIFGIVILLACIVTLAIKRALLKAEAFQIELDKLLLPKRLK